jgi:hypothetical protein
MVFTIFGDIDFPIKYELGEVPLALMKLSFLRLVTMSRMRLICRTANLPSCGGNSYNTHLMVIYL